MLRDRKSYISFRNENFEKKKEERERKRSCSSTLCYFPALHYIYLRKFTAISKGKFEEKLVFMESAFYWISYVQFLPSFPVRVSRYSSQFFTNSLSKWFLRHCASSIYYAWKCFSIFPSTVNFFFFLTSIINFRDKSKI